jgi:hypothetical protein
MLSIMSQDNAVITVLPKGTGIIKTNKTENTKNLAMLMSTIRHFSSFSHQKKLNCFSVHGCSDMELVFKGRGCKMPNFRLRLRLSNATCITSCGCKL